MSNKTKLLYYNYLSGMKPFQNKKQEFSDIMVKIILTRTSKKQLDTFSACRAMEFVRKFSK